MTPCPSCPEAREEGHRFCPDCGAPLDGGEPTATAPHAPSTRPAPPPSTTPSTRSRDGSRFASGDVIADRYRIVSRLGRGGMGEVYRADDLQLGESVALKFLHMHRQGDPGWLSEVREEVRITRGITHPNVCRVYDIAETEGEAFIAMEYIDGEDLSGLLKRIGRFPRDRAVEIARQLCGGLAAAHERGVLHRDLKPANIMIDGRGRARITDFGIAALDAGHGATDGRTAGTPAYMAPEQRAGKPATIQSDLYGLGMVLYELFTGERHVRTGSGITSATDSRTPTAMSEYVSDLDPTIERVIARCLEEEASDRPTSALAVAAALPGGDPLGMALAAGETPSPEMIAEAGESGALSPGRAVGLLVTLLVSLWLLSMASAREDLVEKLDILPVEVLRNQVGSFRDAMDMPAARYECEGFGYSSDIINHLRREDSPEAWSRLDGDGRTGNYWQRSSPGRLIPNSDTGTVSWSNPPIRLSGEAAIAWGSGGMLLEFLRVPEKNLPPPGTAGEVDWVPYFEAAELDIAAARPIDPIERPPFHCERIQAWVVEGPPPAAATRIQAGSVGGEPVWFTTTRLWDDSWRVDTTETSSTSEEPPAPDRGPSDVMMWLISSITMVVVSTGIVLAFRHLRARRGDRSGALRVGLFLTAVMLARWLFTATFQWGPGAVFDLADPVAYAIFVGVLGSVYYLALEPFARRYWPRSLVSWTRLLRGRFRDPLVGRDILIGVLVAILLEFLRYMPKLIGEGVFGEGAIAPIRRVSGAALLGLRGVFGDVAAALTAPVLIFGFFVLLLFFRIITRRASLAVAIMIVLFSAVPVLSEIGSPDPFSTFEMVSGVMFFTALTLTLARFGLLTISVVAVMANLLDDLPVRLASNPTYGEAAWVAPILCVSIAVYGFWVALAGQPIFRDEVQGPAG